MTDGPSPEALGMLKALNRLIRQGRLSIYQGTVSEAEKAKRREKNRVARRQRRVNRQRGA